LTIIDHHRPSSTIIDHHRHDDASSRHGDYAFGPIKNFSRFSVGYPSNKFQIPKKARFSVNCSVLPQ
jgi:hypothetical protein